MQKIEQAKAKLLLEQPFFGSIATNLELTKNNNIASTHYNKDTLEFNSEYIDALNIDEITTILASSAMRQALYHTNRGEGKVQSIWQVASEYAINSLLLENGFVMHPMAKFSQEFNGLYTEEIYHLLLNDYEVPEQEEKEEQEANEQASIEDSEFEILLEQIIQKIESQDKLPMGLERLIKSAKPSKISWRDLLYRYINAHAKIDYKMFPSNKKHLYRGVALPSINSEELKIAVAIDTSASIDESSLNSFLTELEAIMQSFSNYQIELIECDYKIQNTTRLTPLEPIISKVKGGGSTDFRPVFEYLEKLNEDFKFLIYFSDGEGIFPNYIPFIDTLWVLTKEASTPFGEKILLRVS